MRIAIILQTPRDPQSAVFINYQNVKRACEEHGAAVTIVCPDDFPRYPVRGRWTPLVYPLAVAFWLRRRSPPPDVVVFHSYAGWLAAALGWVRGSRVVVAFHGLEVLYHRALKQQAERAGRRLSWRYRFLQEVFMPRALRVACRSASSVVCLNRRERDFLVNAGWTDTSRIVQLAHGAPRTLFAIPREARAVRTLLCTAQWLEMKGVECLRDAFVTLAARYPDLRLVCAGTLVGEGEVLSDFPPDLHTRIRVLPRISLEALAEEYRNADVFVFPSLYEGFGRALIEAMAAGLPIVTTPVGVAADALREGESALFVPPHGVEQMVAAIGRLVDAPGEARRLGEGARAAAARYRDHDLVEQWREIIGA